ncbi:TonB-dependent receptor [Marivibrio halodurans]|uniref:TonB-dependent receptor n=1 Tax=Marivibrio halodurans TaxID=2039722 RepID=A0A8J7RWD1_9PROT|nr:TonB-dependent receptor [Marivibrio halodurans]
MLTTDPNNRGFQIQEGEVRSRGVEVEGKVSPFAGLTLLANYTYTDAEVTKSNTNTLGNTPENTPEWMASLWGEYAFQQSDLDGLVLGGGMRSVGPSVNLADTVEVPTYTVFDAMIGYERNGWEVALNATNLFDREYFASCTYGCFYGDARTLIGTIGYEW